MYGCWESIRDVSIEPSVVPFSLYALTGFFLVVPSNMNPVGEEGNIFSSLFDKVPAKRAAKAEDIAGAVLYLSSKAGVSIELLKFLIEFSNALTGLVVCRWGVSLC